MQRKTVDPRLEAAIEAELKRTRRIALTPLQEAEIAAHRKLLLSNAPKAPKDKPRTRTVESSSAAPASTTAQLRRKLEHSLSQSRSALRALGLSDHEINEQVRELRRGVPIDELVNRFMRAQRAKREGRAAEHAAMAQRMGVVPRSERGVLSTPTSLKLGVPIAAHPERKHDREELARRMGVARDAPLVVSTPYRLELNPPANRVRTERADMHDRLQLDHGELAPDGSRRRSN